MKQLEYCPNFDFIIAYGEKTEESLAHDLITFYQDYMLQEDLDKEASLLFDQSLKAFLSDSKFHKYALLKADVIYEDMMEQLPALYQEYQEEAWRMIATTKWL